MDINDILFEAMKSNASDVHIVCILPPIMRVHGRLIKLEKFGNVTPEISEKMLTGILNDEQKKRLMEKLTVDFSYTMQGQGRFRCSYYYQRNSLVAAFRYISREIPSIEELNLPKQIEEFANSSQGSGSCNRSYRLW